MIKPIFNRRYGDWNEEELAMVMLTLEREYHKEKKRGPLPCDKPSDAENVVVLDVSKSKSPAPTTSTVDTSTCDTRSAKDALAMENAKQMLTTMIKTEAREMLHKFRHTDPDFAQKLEQEFKDEGIL